MHNGWQMNNYSKRLSSSLNGARSKLPTAIRASNVSRLQQSPTNRGIDCIDTYLAVLTLKCKHSVAGYMSPDHFDSES